METKTFMTHPSIIYEAPKEWSNEVISENRFNFHPDLINKLIATGRAYTIHKNFIITQSIKDNRYYLKLFQSVPLPFNSPPYYNIWVRGHIVKKNIEANNCLEEFTEFGNELRVFSECINRLPGALTDLEIIVENLAKQTDKLINHILKEMKGYEVVDNCLMRELTYVIDKYKKQ